MDELGGPAKLEGPTGAELVRDSVRNAIIRGELLPGQAISLRALARRHKLRLPALLITLSVLELEQLLTVRADTAFVAQLSSPELAAGHRFGISMARALLPEALESLTPADLDEVDRLLPVDATDLVDNAKGAARCTQALEALFHRTCTGAILRELRGLLNQGLRYSFFAGEVLDSLRVPSVVGYAAEFREVIHLLRRGRVGLATSRELELVGFLHVFARLGLEYPRLTDDDSPIAEIIPLAQNRRSQPSPISRKPHRLGNTSRRQEGL